MSDSVSVNWFPGHMTRANRKIQQSLKLVDCVAEIIDARIPISSRNPDFNKLLKDKPRVLLFNKCDIADSIANAQWITFYKNNGFNIIAIDAKKGKGLNKFIPIIKKSLKDRILQWEKKGMVSRNIRVMVVGIPNVGKSSFINKLTKNNKAKVEDRPGVTKGNQWFSLPGRIEILDTPGILWPKIEDKIMGENLAFTGAVKDQVIDIESLATRLVEVLALNYSSNLCQRYKLEADLIKNASADDLLINIAKKRGMLMPGGIIDSQRVSEMILDEFRMGKLGRISLEKVEDLSKSGI